MPYVVCRMSYVCMLLHHTTRDTTIHDHKALVRRMPPQMTKQGIVFAARRLRVVGLVYFPQTSTRGVCEFVFLLELRWNAGLVDFLGLSRVARYRAASTSKHVRMIAVRRCQQRHISHVELRGVY